MIVFKLSWLPWMLVIAGISLLADEQGEGGILVLIGAFWLFVRLLSKSGKNVGGSGAPSSAAQVSDSVPTNTTMGKPAAKCPLCGKENRQGALFCEDCGSKL